MTREFNISIINSLLHSWSDKQIQQSNNQFINVSLRDMLHLVACNCLATNLIAMHTSFVVASEAYMGGDSRLVYNFAKKKINSSSFTYNYE